MQETLILEVESLPHLLLVTSNVTVFVKLVQQCRGNMSRLEDSSFIHLLLLVTQINFTVKVTLLLLVWGKKVLMSVMLTKQYCGNTTYIMRWQGCDLLRPVL